VEFVDCVRIVHFARGLLEMVGASRRQELASGLRQVFASATREQALANARQLAAVWRGSHPKVASALEEDIESCLACLAFPVAHQPRIRTTNGLERLNQDLKRRTRVARIFPHREACLRLVTALCMEQSEEWLSGRRYLGICDFAPDRHQEMASGADAGASTTVPAATLPSRE
jgi:transposase-like protein